MKVKHNTVEIKFEDLLRIAEPDELKELFAMAISDGYMEEFIEDLCEGETYLDGSYSTNYELRDGGLVVDKAQEIRKLILRKIKGPYSYLWPHTIPVTQGQVEYEIKFLWSKLKKRSCPHFKKHIKAEQIQLHPTFYLINGDIEPWEKVKDIK